MNQIEELHDKAMEAIDQALLAWRMVDEKQAEAAFLRAYKLESEADHLTEESH